LKHYRPEDDLTKLAARMVIRSKDNILRIELKDNEAQLAALNAGFGIQGKAFDSEEARVRDVFKSLEASPPPSTEYDEDDIAWLRVNAPDKLPPHLR
jgi:hypothetical protein